MDIPTPDQQALAHVCQILEMDANTAAFLQQHRITSIRKFTTTTVDRYEELVSVAGSPMDNTDICQINLFRAWYTSMIEKRGRLTAQDIIQELNEEEWDNFCNTYLLYIQNQQSQAAASPPPLTPIGQVQQVPQAPAPQVSSFKVTLKDYPITTGKASDWPRFRRKFIATATANGHDEVLDPNYIRPSRRNEPQEYAKYLKMNQTTFSALDYGTTDSIIRHKVNRFRADKDGRAAFLEIDTYQRGQGSEEVCASNAWDELSNMKLTSVYPGGMGTFLAKWEDAVDKLRDVNQAPNEFLERTLLKSAIQDEDYASVLTGLDLMDTVPTVDRCKAKIRKKGAKLEANRKSTAVRKARMTHQDVPVWSHPVEC